MRVHSGIVSKLDGSGGTGVRVEEVELDISPDKASARQQFVELVEDEDEDDEENYGGNQDTASFEHHRNVQLDLSKMQLPITAMLNPVGNQINIGRLSNSSPKQR